jgi:hypothetical protein
MLNNKKNMKTAEIHNLDIGSKYLKVKLSDLELLTIKDEIKLIEKDFSKAISFNSKLIGNIKNEYELITSFSNIEQLLIPYVKHFTNKISTPKLQSVWVNFQKKYEYNPLHNHTGDISFVIWIQIPFKNSEELAIAPSPHSKHCSSGNFQFVAADKFGKLKWEYIPADKSYENTLLIFPSDLCHAVYPFFSSDEYRISVSGNFMN